MTQHIKTYTISALVDGVENSYTGEGSVSEVQRDAVKLEWFAAKSIRNVRWIEKK